MTDKPTTDERIATALERIADAAEAIAEKLALWTDEELGRLDVNVAGAVETYTVPDR